MPGGALGCFALAAQMYAAKGRPTLQPALAGRSPGSATDLRVPDGPPRRALGPHYACCSGHISAYTSVSRPPSLHLGLSHATPRSDGGI